MTAELSDFYQLIGQLRAEGLNEAQAHAKAEEILEAQSSDEEVKAT